MDRDISINPYSVDEQRVVDYIMSASGLGAGDDPIGFLLASHASIVEELSYIRGLMEPMLKNKESGMLNKPLKCPRCLAAMPDSNTCQQCGYDLILRQDSIIRLYDFFNWSLPKPTQTK